MKNDKKNDINNKMKEQNNDTDTSNDKKKKIKIKSNNKRCNNKWNQQE